MLGEKKRLFLKIRWGRLKKGERERKVSWVNVAAVASAERNIGGVWLGQVMVEAVAAEAVLVVAVADGKEMSRK